MNKKTYNLWNETLKIMTDDIVGFFISNKSDTRSQRFLSKCFKIFSYGDRWTTIFPKVYTPITNDFNKKHNYIILQHEWVHLKDCQTIFGLLKNKKSKYIGKIVFNLLYFSPQIFSLFSLLAFVNLYWLFCLLFLLPIPSPRFWIELRAFRRTLELNKNEELQNSICNSLCSIKYYYSFFSKKITKKLLLKNSPYKNLMNKTLI